MAFRCLALPVSLEVEEMKSNCSRSPWVRRNRSTLAVAFEVRMPKLCDVAAQFDEHLGHAVDQLELGDVSAHHRRCRGR